MTKEPDGSSVCASNADLTALQNNIRSQWLILILVLAILAGIFGFQSYSSHREITSQEQQRLQTQARVVASNIEWSLEATNLSLSSLIKDMDYLRHHDNLQLTNRRLQALSDAMPGVHTLFVLDQNGVVVASNRSELIGRNFSARDYFATPARDKNPSTLYLSQPFKTVLGHFAINISRIIRTSNGDFNGIVTATLDPEYFHVLLSSVLYAPDMLSAINHGDGIRFMIVPDQDGQPGKNLMLPGTFFSRHQVSGRQETVFTGKSPSYPSQRVMALRTVQPEKLRLDKPLYVACSREYSAIYKDWRGNNLKQLLAFALICAGTVAGLILLQRRQRALALLAARNKELIKLRLNLLEYAGTHDLRDLLSRAMGKVCALSDSQIAFCHFVEPDQRTISLQVCSTRVGNKDSATIGPAPHYQFENTASWAECVRQRKAVIRNDSTLFDNRKDLPENQAPMGGELLTPVIRADRVVAILGMSNKSTGYSDQDIELATILANLVWEIAQRKRSEEERLELGVRYKTLQSVSRDGIHILDWDGNLVESNSAFREMLGYGTEGGLKLHVRDWDAGIPREELTAKVRELIHAPAIFESRFRRKDGTIFDVEISACGVQLDEVWYLYASSRDISNRKEMERSLRESRQFLSDVFDFLPDATFVVDRDKKVIAWNKAMEEMSDVPREKILGQGDHAYTIPFYGERRGQLLDLLDVDDSELKEKYQHVTRLGKRLFADTFCPALHNGKGAHVWAVVAPLFDGDGKRIGAIESIRDITAIKETEADLERSNRELEMFAYVASHDLQEPLRKITGFTELFANRYRGALDEKAESYISYIVDGSARMRTLINDLLSYSRIMRSTRQFKETDSSTVVSKVLRDLEPAIKESNAEIVCGPLPVILADQTQLGQLFQNLISNAIKYRGADPPRIHIGANRQDAGWLFFVADNGIGIAPEFFERIFVIFQRLHTREEYPGTGIGLAVCQKIVERHGGKIWLESTPGAGSTFFFTIPITPIGEN